MTMNVAATVWNMLVWAFFVVAIVGVAVGTYAAVSMKRAEVDRED